MYNYIFFCFLLVSSHHGPTPLSTYVVIINKRIAQGAADSWDQAARAVFVFLRCEHCRVFWCLPHILIFLLWTATKTSLQVLTGRVVARLAQARYPAQIFFFKLKMASPAILFLGIPRQGQVVILHPAGLQIFPRRYALGLTRKWALRNNKWDVIIKTG